MAGPPGASFKFTRTSAAQESELTGEEDLCAPAIVGRMELRRKKQIAVTNAVRFIRLLSLTWQISAAMYHSLGALPMT
jgi:hypothetical protein